MTGPRISIKINKTTCQIFYKEKHKHFINLFWLNPEIIFPTFIRFVIWSCFKWSLIGKYTIFLSFDTKEYCWQNDFLNIFHWRIKSVFRLILLMNLQLLRRRITGVEYDYSVLWWSKMVEREKTGKILRTKRSNQCRVVTTTTPILTDQ